MMTFTMMTFSMMPFTMMLFTMMTFTMMTLSLRTWHSAKWHSAQCWYHSGWILTSLSKGQGIESSHHIKHHNGENGENVLLPVRSQTSGIQKWREQLGVLESWFFEVFEPWRNTVDSEWKCQKKAGKNERKMQNFKSHSRSLQF